MANTEKSLGIRSKLTLSLIGLAFLLLTIMGILYVISTYDKLNTIETYRNRYLSSDYANKILTIITEKGADALEALDDEIIKSDNHVLFYILKDGGGRVVKSSLEAERVQEISEQIPSEASEPVSDVEMNPFGTIQVVTSAFSEYGTLTLAFQKSTVFDVVREERRIIIFLYIGAVAFALLVSFFIASRIVTPLKTIMFSIKAVGRGETDIDIPIRSGDEFGEIARTLNETLGRLREYIQTDEERKNTQESLIRFLGILSEASAGDFSEKAPVTADVFGSLADAYNLMIDGLTELLLDVSKSAEIVGTNSNNMIEIFEKMGQGAEEQMVEVKKASESVDEASHATTHISEKSASAQKITTKAAEASQKGGELVIQTIEGMQLIRVTAQAINKRMKNLSEKLLEIGSISQLIGEIASRTNLLAMNASIEAARAGEQGKGFVVIAEEIRALADRSTEATRNITGIVKAIQTEASEVTTALEEETNHVETQTDISKNTGMAFKKIDETVQESSKVVADIYNLSRDQRDLAQNVVLAMEQVNKISLQMLKFTKDSTMIADKLSITSVGLLESISKFRLREKQEKTIEIEK